MRVGKSMQFSRQTPCVCFPADHSPPLLSVTFALAYMDVHRFSTPTLPPNPHTERTPRRRRAPQPAQPPPDSYNQGMMHV